MVAKFSCDICSKAIKGPRITAEFACADGFDTDEGLVMKSRVLDICNRCWEELTAWLNSWGTKRG